jgi:hypothetical protein
MKQANPKKNNPRNNKPGERRKGKPSPESHRTPVGQAPASTDRATSPSYKVREIAIAKIKVVGKRRA